MRGQEDGTIRMQLRASLEWIDRNGQLNGFGITTTLTSDRYAGQLSWANRPASSSYPRGNAHRPRLGIDRHLQQLWVHHPNHLQYRSVGPALGFGNTKHGHKNAPSIERNECFGVKVAFSHGDTLPRAHPVLPIELVKRIQQARHNVETCVVDEPLEPGSSFFTIPFTTILTYLLAHFVTDFPVMER